MKKVAVVTGAAQGMGYGTAINFLKKGYNVVFTDKNIKYLSKNKKKILVDSNSNNFIIIESNVSQIKSCQNLFLKTFKKWSRIDILVNCAGIAGGKREGGHTLAEFEHTVTSFQKALVNAIS